MAYPSPVPPPFCKGSTAGRACVPSQLPVFRTAKDGSNLRTTTAGPVHTQQRQEHSASDPESEHVQGWAGFQLRGGFLWLDPHPHPKAQLTSSLPRLTLGPRR